MPEKLYIVDEQGKCTAVLLEIEAYDALLIELEQLREMVNRSSETTDSQPEEEKAIVEDRLKALGYL
jgi:hypothetical protein